MPIFGIALFALNGLRRDHRFYTHPDHQLSLLRNDVVLAI